MNTTEFNVKLNTIILEAIDQYNVFSHPKSKTEVILNASTKIKELLAVRLPNKKKMLEKTDENYFDNVTAMGWNSCIDEVDYLNEFKK